MGRRIRILLALVISLSALLTGIVPATAAGNTLYVDDDASCGGLSPCYTSIQAAIDGASAGDTISVWPGVYSETASGRYLFNGTGPYQFGLFVRQDKEGLTIQGLAPDGQAVTNAANAVAYVTTNATNSFGYSGIFVEADRVTVTGLRIGPNTPSDNKTIEVIGDAFTLKFCQIDVPEGGSVYFGDWRYDLQTAKAHIESYTVQANAFLHSASLDIANGAGASGEVKDRVVSGNSFSAEPGDTWALVSFNGTVPDVGWFVYPVGGADVESNTFSGGEQYIRSRGTVVESTFDWESYWEDNTFDKASMVVDDSGAVRPYSYDSGGRHFDNCRRIGAMVQSEVDHALDGDTVLVKAGTYAEDVVIPVSLTLSGANAGICAGRCPGARGPETVIEGSITANADNVTIDGVKVVASSTSGSGVVLKNSSTGHTVENSVLVGAGTSVAARGVEMGSTVTNTKILNNEISGWMSGVYIGGVATYPSLDVVVEGNYIHDNVAGVGSDYLTDVSVLRNRFAGNTEAFGSADVGARVAAHFNNFETATDGVNQYNGGSIDARFNWWNGAGTSGTVDAGRPASTAYTCGVTQTVFTGLSLQQATPDPMYPGQQIVVDVMVDNVTDLAGLDLSLSFDSARLQLVGAPSGTAWFPWDGTPYPGNSVNNSTGTIRWAATLPLGGAPVSGNGAIMRLTFQATSAGQATIGFVLGHLDDTLLTDTSGQVLVPDSVTGATVTIGSLPAVTGTVLLQGRSDHSGTAVALDVLSDVTDTAGAYDFAIAPGAYSITMEKSSYLDTWSTVTVPDTGLIVATKTLRFGDVNDDDKINIQDLAFIAYRYDPAGTASRYDARADMNLDNLINIYDLTAAAGNYGSTSVAF